MTKPNTHKEIEECVFCGIANRSGIGIVDIEPLNPIVKGHRIVFSAQHSEDFTDDIGTTMRVVQRASEIARETGGAFNLITSAGANATQTVFHLHVHLVPRKKGDGLALPWDIKSTQSQILDRAIKVVERIKDRDWFAVGKESWRNEAYDRFLDDVTQALKQIKTDE